MATLQIIITSFQMTLNLKSGLIVEVKHNFWINGLIFFPDTFQKPGDATQTNNGPIDLLISLNPIDGIPALTLGSSEPPSPGPPSSSYRAVLAAGMSEMGLTSAEITRYLSVLETKA